ncbi:hypothetical protein TBLA_0C03240 [Henningerozyma blattae CBS 6284]|uniref:Uncharacterized protein n=1 Tax=Henningerozyma blattae (strain ATCC 34711 / CBS 6284 / DSM 70876 / NBRC 10599 / NRRL Y-10934 / UCD 77-7) TaxID=1071380 RepID=I2H176_HENB6|nr:hypothetical protein TBLA_0C03240 [Tetrapisispora blattae CBS 6284]CCH60128.1 hypothetical protein TBLA_0C03240 [Tetrapisispora blattae CBS 6284]
MAIQYSPLPLETDTTSNTSTTNDTGIPSSPELNKPLQQDQSNALEDDVISQSDSNINDSYNHTPMMNNTDRTSYSIFQILKQNIRQYAKFVGPGLMVSVAYMDPGNYSTAVAAGSAHKYKLLFSVLVSNIIAAFFQCLCAKLGAVTGLDLAQNCRKHLHPYINIALYVLAEIAIIATDLAEVVGTAIALNILFDIPLALGVILTTFDVLIVLMAYRPSGSLNVVRWFEAFVSVLVIATVVCFALEMHYADLGPWCDIAKGFIPSKAVIKGDGLYLSLAILGATVMPHSLYLGSGVVQPRLRDFDIKSGHYKPTEDDELNNHIHYHPSYEAINETLNMTVAELLVSLFTVALFVNCSILIVAGATLYGNTPASKEADLFSIYNLLSTTLSKTAGTVFVLALLFSGQSAGIVCTLSGQMVSEGFLHWSIQPAVRRALTRAVAITPCLILVLVAGREGLSGALNASQVVLSLLLPFVSAPLLYFTSSKGVMSVLVVENDDVIPLQDMNSNNNSLNTTATTNNNIEENEISHDFNSSVNLNRSSINEEDINDEINPNPLKCVDMSNNKITTVIAVFLWLLISGLNFYMLLSFAAGQDVNF